MELYTRVSYAISQRITLDYSTSFGSSTKLFSSDIRPYIYAIYGLVRIADEVVDVYRGDDSLALLRELEAEVYASLKRGYSVNPVVHSFSQTAVKFDITEELIRPFFESMAMDIAPAEYNEQLYERYIYGSAEVIGLMCLKVFVYGNSEEYERLESGARALGSAYQKVNFLRDMAADYNELGRVYFPGVTFDTFDEAAKHEIIQDIEAELGRARRALVKLPLSSRRAVGLSVAYYGALLKKLKQTAAADIKQRRVRINNGHKLVLFIWAVIVGVR